ncbi:MAG: MATE family efflux transporter [Clostridia bacterium]|nr:MATE family efflux transporter [Clostridia bacterium]
MSDKALDSQFKRMTEGELEPLILKLAVPTIISMLISSVYNMADTYFVGRIGTSATAAVGVAFSLMAMIQAIGFFFGHGSGNFISRAMGRQEYEDANTMASVGFYSAIAGGLLITAVGLVFLQPLAMLLGSTKTILPYACDYMRYILLAAPFMTGSFALNNQLRFQGRATYAMIGITTGGILNMLLDPLFIFGFDMGVAGAAVATMLSQMVGFTILLIMVLKKGIPVKPSYFKFRGYYYKEMFRGGLPSLARQGCGSIATLCLNNVAGAYGDPAIAAVSVVSRITMFAYSALIGYGQGFQPVCGVNYGAERYDRVRKAFWFCVKTSFAIQLALAVLGFIFAEPLVGLLRDDPEVIVIGTRVLRFQCVSFPLSGYVVFCNMMSQTIGMAGKATFLALSRQFLFFVPAIFLLEALFGLAGLEGAQALADLCSFAVSVPIGLSILKTMKHSE